MGDAQHAAHAGEAAFIADPRPLPSHETQNEGERGRQSDTRTSTPELVNLLAPVFGRVLRCGHDERGEQGSEASHQGAAAGESGGTEGVVLRRLHCRRDHGGYLQASWRSDGHVAHVAL